MRIVIDSYKSLPSWHIFAASQNPDEHAWVQLVEGWQSFAPYGIDSLHIVVTVRDLQSIFDLQKTEFDTISKS